VECQAGRAAMGLEAQETRLEKIGHGAEEDDGARAGGEILKSDGL